MFNQNFEELETWVDIVYCIDLTHSMSPIIDLVKKTALSLDEQLRDGLAEKGRAVSKLRVKVVGFRDLYVEREKALEISDFFSLPGQKDEFYDFVRSLKAAGGGDFPENSLEAIALAMNSNWCQTYDPDIRKRHIIVLFTDAEAHPLEKAAQGTNKFYPPNMPADIDEFIDMWTGQNAVMDDDAKRLVVYAPGDSDLFNLFDSQAGGGDIYAQPIEKDTGGKDLSNEMLIDMLTNSIA